MAKGSALTKELKCSDELREFLGEKKISRGQMVKKIWKYIKKKGLQSEKDKRIVEVDEKLEPLFGKAAKNKREIKMRGKKIKIPAGSIFMTEFGKALSKHLS